jgi:SAM-dependent methyltransferase
VSAAEERLVNDPSSELWGEHRSRYRFAAQFAAGRRVLDVASGAGFGLQMLLEAGATAVGVDYDFAALQSARSVEPTAGLLNADATRLAIADACVDLVVSFETLEHVPDAGALVREVSRVLKPRGRLVLSTPNRAFRTSANPFHVREFTATELRTLLGAFFEEVRLYGQRPSPAYRYVPFLMVEPHLEPAAIAWKLTTRLPFPLKNRLARALSGRDFYPSENDYCFLPDRCDGSHALLAVARK